MERQASAEVGALLLILGSLEGIERNIGKTVLPAVLPGGLPGMVAPFTWQ